MRPQLHLVALAAAGALLLAACSEGGTTASSSPPTAAPATDAPSGSEPAATTTTEQPTTTTEPPPPPVYPLTGLPAESVLAALRPVVVVKVGNYDAHPPTGLNAADLVYEELINDNVSRFAAVFQSSFPEDSVGPARSGRLQDVDLLGSLGAPILAWSGGNGKVTRAIDDSDLVNLSQSYCADACFRVDFDKAPYNLYFDVQRSLDVGAPLGAGNPMPQFQWREPGADAVGDASAGVFVTMDAYDVEWTWNAGTDLYERRQNGKVHDERDGSVITTDNIVVLSMVYLPGISGSPDAQSVGMGEAWVFTGGTVVHGAWVRADRLQPFTLTDDDGDPILLTPGRTWVELPRAEDGTVVVK